MDIAGFLADYQGFNVLRVWDYTPAKDWGASAWESCSASEWLTFIRHVNAKGFAVELTLLTDDDPARVEHARDLITKLADFPDLVLLLEAGNEPTTHKAIHTADLQAWLEDSPHPYSSGDYEDSRRWFGSYGTFHSGRDSEWPRRAHDALDYYHGGGPNFPEEPPCRAPWVADEPIRPDQASGDRAQDFLAYYATCSLLGAGATIHTETGKTGQRPTNAEKPCIAAALQGLNAFPPDAPRGPYSRPDEGPATLRTYKVGPYTVRIRPTDGVVIP